MFHAHSFQTANCVVMDQFAPHVLTAMQKIYPQVLLLIYFFRHALVFTMFRDLQMPPLPKWAPVHKVCARLLLKKRQFIVLSLPISLRLM